MAERSKNDYPIDFFSPLIQYIRSYEHHNREAGESWADGRKLLREWLAIQPNKDTSLAWLQSQPFAPMGLVIPQDIINAVVGEPLPTILPAPQPPVTRSGWGEVHSHRNAAGLSPEPDDEEQI